MFFDETELTLFHERIEEQLGSEVAFNYIGELKIDGLSISLEYENYELKTASTRGDGWVGEDVTLNVYAIAAIPQRISVPHLVVRGEIYFSKADFAALNAEQAAKKESLYANARNAASGTLRNLNVALVAKRTLSAFFYDCQGVELQTQADLLAFLAATGFPVNPHYQVLESVADLTTYAQQQETKRDQFPYEIDGAVFKLNQVGLRHQMGATSKFPKWATAYKFAAVYATTQVQKIVATVGRTGRINYIAELVPVNLLGTTVSKATLHNYDFIAMKDLRVGDMVQVYKAGEIIPEIAQVLLDQRPAGTQTFAKATTCPSCMSQLVQLEDEVDQYCRNLACEAQQIKAISHYVSRGAMDIRGLSEQIITKLWQANMLRSFLDLYTLAAKRDDLIALPNMGVKSVDNLLHAIAHSRQQTVIKLLYGLGIKHVGLRTATLLMRHFLTLDALAQASVTTINTLKNIGPEIAESVTAYFAEHQLLLDQLHSLDLPLTLAQPTKVSQSLVQGQKFVLTGTLSQPRQYYVKLLEHQGAEVQTRVSARTNYVVVGLNPGQKALAAQQRDIPLVDEAALCQLLEVPYEKKD